jgi:hypothetical protein
MFNLPALHLLTASIIAGLIGISSFLLGPTIIGPAANVRIEPGNGLAVVGETFVVAVIVDASIPVNVFKGLLTFDSERLEVTAIDYNTSIANLWAEEPWYSNGDGTINFIGGTTKSGGFIGEGHLITVTFKTKASGDAHIALSEMIILQHDGLGTVAETTTTIDSIFAIADGSLKDETIFETTLKGPTVSVVPVAPDTDLNDDGKQTIADVSIFMTDLVVQNERSDFNQDGTVDLRDLSILTQR